MNQVNYDTFVPIQRDNFELYQIHDVDQAIKYIYSLLSGQVNRQATMFISHGNHVIKLMNLISQFETMEPHSIVMWEEILGESFHYNSYEYHYQTSGLIETLSKRGIPFFRILQRAPTLGATVRIYATRIEEILHAVAYSHLFIELYDDAGLGGIRPQTKNQKHQLLEQHELVVGYRQANTRGTQDDIVSLTPEVFKKINNIWIFAYGLEKAAVLKKLFKNKTVDPKEFPLLHLKNHPGKIRIFTDQIILKG